MKMTKNDILARKYSQLIFDGFKLFFKNAGIVIIFFFCVYIVPIFINSFLLADLTWFNGFYYGFFTYSILIGDLLESLFLRSFSVIAFCPIAMYLYGKYTKNESSFFQNFKNALNYKLILVWIILAVALPTLYSFLSIFIRLLGVLLGVVFSFIFLKFIQILLTSYFIFMVFTYSIRDHNSTFSKTEIYRKGSFFKILLIMGIYMIIIEVFRLTLSLIWNPSFSKVHSWYDINDRRYDLIILNNFISSLPVLILGTLQIALLTPLFASQVAKKRNVFETKVVGDGQRIQHISNIEKKESCQFCGKLVRTNEKFCLNCGKLIE